ncbi:MAG: TetR/AcrR family transcriptional regulator [Pseudomonadota bacterium]
MASKRRDHLVDQALDMFQAEGYHATGIDKILSQAGVAKMTLYNHFKSKDDLILAVLDRRDGQFFQWLNRRMHQHPGAARDQLLALFDALEEWFQRDDFRGCLFINAAAEYPTPSDPIHARAAAHKRRLYESLSELARQAGAKRPGELAAHLMLLSDGAIVTKQVNSQAPAAAQAKKAAALLVDHALVA